MQALTVNDLIEALQGLVAEKPEVGTTLVGASKDPEGNGFSVFQGPERLVSFGTIEAWGPSEHNGKPVMVLWPGYPQFDLQEDS